MTNKRPASEMKDAPKANPWQPMGIFPKVDVVDVLAKTWVADADIFVWVRFTNCFLLNDRVVFQPPGPAGPQSQPVDLKSAGYLPCFWMKTPEYPSEVQAVFLKGERAAP